MPAEFPVPPEAKLLHLARSSQRLSIREAARRAGISENRWRQIEAGYQTVSKGVTVPTDAKAATLASMAHVVGVSPERLESEGQRPDAAEILREIRRQDVSARSSEAEDQRHTTTLHPDPVQHAPKSAEMVLGADMTTLARPYASAIFLRLRDLAAEGVTEPTGAQVFGAGSRDAQSWDLHADELSLDELVWLIAALQQRQQAIRDRQSRAGLAPA